MLAPAVSMEPFLGPGALCPEPLWLELQEGTCCCDEPVAAEYCPVHAPPPSEVEAMNVVSEPLELHEALFPPLLSPPVSMMESSFEWDRSPSPPVSTGLSSHWSPLSPSPPLPASPVPLSPVPPLPTFEPTYEGACESEIPPAAPARRKKKNRSSPYVPKRKKRKSKSGAPESLIPGTELAFEVLPQRPKKGKPLEIVDGVPVVELRRESENKVVQKNGKINKGARPRYVTVRVSVVNSAAGHVLPRAGSGPPFSFDIVERSGPVHTSVPANYVVSASSPVAAIFKINVTQIAVPNRCDNITEVKHLSLRVREAFSTRSLGVVPFGVRWRSQRGKKE